MTEVPYLSDKNLIVWALRELDTCQKCSIRESLENFFNTEFNSEEEVKAGMFFLINLDNLKITDYSANVAEIKCRGIIKSYCGRQVPCPFTQDCGLYQGYLSTRGSSLPQL